MIDDGIWVRRRDRIKRVHQPRHRRDCLGELVQVDACEHWGFEDRGPQCTLLVFVDDATSRLMHLSFVASESAFAYFQAARTYLEDHGKPIALYSDKHSVFRSNKPEQAEGGMTQLQEDASASLIFSAKAFSKLITASTGLRSSSSPKVFDILHLVRLSYVFACFRRFYQIA
jgi:hypothetical protein